MADGTDDLKAKLGLKKRRKKVEEEKAAAAAKAEADAAAAKVAAKEQRASDIASARARAAAADAEAGPAAEEFGFMGAESTPVPERYEGPQYVVVEGSEEMAGDARKRLVTLIATAAATFVVAFLMGSMAGSASSESETLDLYAKQAGAKLKGIAEKQDKSGAKVIDRLAEMKTQLDTVHVQIRAIVEKKGGPNDGDWEALSPKLNKTVEAMVAYKKDGVFIDPDSLTNELFALGPVANFAVRTRLLYDKVSSAIAEAKAISEVATAAPNPEQAIRFVYTEVSEREVTQQKWWKTGADGKRVAMTECKDSKDCNDGFTCKTEIKKCFAPRVPERKVASIIRSVPDMGRTQVGTVDPKNPNSEPVYDWKMLLVLDEKTDEGKPRVIPASTKDVIQMDLTKAFTQMAAKAQTLVTKRIATIILEAHAMSTSVDWAKVEKRLKACAEQKKCSGDAS